VYQIFHSVSIPMLRSIICLQRVLLSCLYTCSAFDFAFPSRFDVPQQVEAAMGRFPAAPVRAAEGVVSAHMRNRVSEQVHDALRCCRAFSADCLACAANQDVTSFCAERRNLRISGCDAKLQAARVVSRDNSLDDVFSGLASTASHVNDGNAASLADEYLDKHPAVARTSVADMSSAAFNTMSLLKSWLMSDLEEDDTVDAHQMDSSDVSALTGLVTAEPEQSATYHAHVRASEAISIQNPWVIIVCALLLIAVSSGIAVGALVHARLQAPAREPLLSTLLQNAEAQPPRQADTV